MRTNEDRCCHVELLRQSLARQMDTCLVTLSHHRQSSSLTKTQLVSSVPDLDLIDSSDLTLRRDETKELTYDSKKNCVFKWWPFNEEQRESSDEVGITEDKQRRRTCSRLHTHSLLLWLLAFIHVETEFSQSQQNIDTRYNFG